MQHRHRKPFVRSGLQSRSSTGDQDDEQRHGEVAGPVDLGNVGISGQREQRVDLAGLGVADELVLDHIRSSPPGAFDLDPRCWSS